MKPWQSLIVFIVLVLAASLLGGLSVPDAWYAALDKPAFNPPGWVFGPAWALLYALMAFAAWRVYRISGFDVAIALWLAQLLVNALWSPLFFAMHRIDLALIDIVLLDLLVVATTVAFFRRDRIAGWLMTPYLAWIAFATALNAAIWSLNQG
ncbi:MAG TPA: TspO/MBR family protein [Dokdonella sp.]|uniref:TspO/MBR family protein n=1 Tax=Dokdonella sp. TaxID=2291710 RepID=UPI002D80B12F|nr:TspO/MBR family protein [Dokdonella sp.]HET9033375.1 TspO/MBR family protein [Dokdonella sp.]